MITIDTIKALAALKPLELIQVPLSRFEAIGNTLSFEEITGIFSQGYHPLDKGNTKLTPGVLSFSLLPVVTCNQRCPRCYDVRSLRYEGVRLKRVINTILASSRHIDRLFYAISKQILNSRTVSAVRIHVGGDFFNLMYTLEWAKIASNMKDLKPGIPVYTYTKTEFTKTLQAAGINVVKSKLDDGRLNFGTPSEVKAMAKEFKGVICPATLGKTPDHFCGSKCKACQVNENVFFVLH